MPNHITNVLDVTGSAEDVEKFRVAVSSDNPALIAHYKREAQSTAEEKKREMEGEDPTSNTYKFYKDQYERALKSLEKPMEAVLDFNGTVPFPEELMGTVSGSESSKPDWQKKRSEELIKKYGADNWYDWNTSNWGTKWNAYSVSDVEEIEGGLRYKFDTAWSPPTGWLDKTAQLFPSLKFVDTFINEGGGAGRITIHVDEGIEEEEELEDIEWKLEYNEDFREKYNLIKEGNYEEIIEYWKDMDEIEDSDLAKPLLDRIKDEDLPIFLNFEWYHDGVEEEYKERLKNAEH